VDIATRTLLGHGSKPQPFRVDLSTHSVRGGFAVGLSGAIFIGYRSAENNLFFVKSNSFRASYIAATMKQVST